MESIDDYTESRLESKGLTIRNYKRQENSCGITEINYEVVDRGAGCGAGALAGATTSLGGIVTAIGISVLFPPAAVPALVTAGLSPYVTVTGGAAIGAAVGKNVHHTKIFHSTSGEFLGESKNDAAQKANNRGLQHCEKYQFEDAKNWFHAAYYTCTSGASKESQYKNNWEATKIAAEAQSLWNKGQLAEAKQKFQEACDKATVAELQTTFTNRRDEVNRLIEAESNTNRGTSANEHYQQARRLWNEAWEAENDTNRDRSDEATRKYEQANCFFRKASECVPDNTVYQKWVKISSLKIEGNTLFNEGLSLQEQANALMQRMLYSEALRKYQEALKKFQEGYDYSKDERFLACIDLVRSCIHETTEAMRSAQTVEGELNNERNDQANESYFFHSS